MILTQIKFLDDGRDVHEKVVIGSDHVIKMQYCLFKTYNRKKIYPLTEIQSRGALVVTTRVIETINEIMEMTK